jgi:hypothetical protein
LASAWLDEWQSDEHGDASEFIHDLCSRAIPGVTGALVVLAEAASVNEDFIAWVGAGPLEYLISHSGGGLEMIAEVEQAAGRNPAFRAALGHVWLGTDVPATVTARLAKFGARVVGSI